MPSAAVPSELIDGVYQVPFKSFGDDRGYFFESYRRSWIPGVREMIQGNCSFSRAGVLRGLHYHMKQADLWAVPTGLVRAALFDFRTSSPTRGRTQVLEMGDGKAIGLYIPKGVAHGFYALRDSFMTYLVDEYYDNTDELGILWSDPELQLNWGADSPIVSPRDAKNPRLSDIPADLRPR
ncbi:MAG TPA: dTDP-4-dehydrorhamnose 3,5-epimerase family protein [Polyangia bacterium]|nr:dTDP-4-dehydrorhamnose 3,5-epimerase family protein [Polyangia bacterium]